MSNKDLFDILENAENDSMERLIEKCPEISDEQLDKIFVMSEKKFRAQIAEEERTKRDNNIKMAKSDIVEGVERIRRPSWLTPLSTAASIVLIAGIAIGSTVMLNRNSNLGGGGVVTPAVTVTTSPGTITGTGAVSTDKNGSAITVSSATTTVTVVTVTDQESKDTKEGTVDTEFINRFIGKWKYQESSINNINEADTIETKGIVQINEDATYTYTDNNGNVSTGTIKKVIEEIGGSEIIRLDFSGNIFKINGAYFVESRPYELHFGNGYAARLLRYEYEDTHGTSASWQTAYRETLKTFMESEFYSAESKWDIQDLDGDGTPELLISQDTSYGSFIYYYENGSATIVGNIVVENFGRNGSFLFCKNENLVGFTDSSISDYHADSFTAYIGKYNNHYIQQLQILSKFSYPEQPQAYYYDVDNEYVSEEEYNKALSNFNSKEWIEVGRRYSFGDYSPLS
ncbi:hypothetical protein [Ruminococcus sp.]|uniref:hypothetical protein n=1 Tax=Ruminococcus sp. TaxID=41978 RepID=UPI0025D63529|nr:hypothetical protein [Ruminococcus sp.]